MDLAQPDSSTGLADIFKKCYDSRKAKVINCEREIHISTHAYCVLAYEEFVKSYNRAVLCFCYLARKFPEISMEKRKYGIFCVSKI